MVLNIVFFSVNFKIKPLIWNFQQIISIPCKYVLLTNFYLLKKITHTKTNLHKHPVYVRKHPFTSLYNSIIL